ncbi:epoxide hydrolase N-terminal domain-containing protein [Nonomuraea wenchangensis]|uniref:epoxide hydrolase N-terminal domain-containing protein n=1 Tax=Nonomuraea wenchangensis TaxID=568860 RepID=UPI00371B5F0E
MTFTGEISPFRIDVPQSVLDDLHDRLARTLWPDELPGVGWSYGIPVSYVKRLAEHWRSGYDWRQHEAALNEHPQFTTVIDGQTWWRRPFPGSVSPVPPARPAGTCSGWRARGRS